MALLIERTAEVKKPAALLTGKMIPGSDQAVRRPVACAANTLAISSSAAFA